MSKKNTAHRPSQSDQEWVITQDGQRVRNTAYQPKPVEKTVNVPSEPVFPLQDDNNYDKRITTWATLSISIRTSSCTALMVPLQSPLMVQENGTGMGTFTGRMAPLLSGARNAPCSGSTPRAGTTTMMPRYPALKENGG